MASILELTVQIITARLTHREMSIEEIRKDSFAIKQILTDLENGESTPPEQKPSISIRQAFKKNEVICMVCGKGFTSLKRHLQHAHELTPRAYRTQFSIPASTPLVAKSYSESRRQDALDRNQAEKLATYRKKKKTAAKGKTATQTKPQTKVAASAKVQKKTK